MAHLIFHVITFMCYLLYNSKIRFDSCRFEQLYLKADNLKHIIFKKEISWIFLGKPKPLKYDITMH